MVAANARLAFTRLQRKTLFLIKILPATHKPSSTAPIKQKHNIKEQKNKQKENQ